MSEERRTLPFPFSRSGLSTEPQPKDLGLTALSLALDPSGAGARGHWCRHCRGVWYSYFAEARCPACGRSG
jgi:hypothetical protein